MNEKEPKNIVLISLDIEGSGMIGGSEQETILKFEKYLQRNGKEVKIIDNKAIGVEKSLSIEFTRSKEKLDEIIKNSLAFFSRQQKSADLIHSFNLISGACGLEISKKYQVRHLHSFYSLGRMNIEDNTSLTEQQSFLDTWELKIFENAESLISPSSYLAENFLNLYPEKFHEKLIIIPPGTDHELFSP